MLGLDLFGAFAVGGGFQDSGGFGQGGCADGAGGALEGMGQEGVVLPAFVLVGGLEALFLFFCIGGELSQEGTVEGFILLAVVQAAGGMDACLLERGEGTFGLWLCGCIGALSGVLQRGICT